MRIVGMLDRAVGLMSAGRLKVCRPSDLAAQAGLPTYDPNTSVLVPAGQRIYDPTVFDRYDLRSQRVVPVDQPAVRFGHLDLLMAEAQRARSYGEKRLSIDRYQQSLPLLVPGKGVLLDACTPTPKSEVTQHVESLGYEYRAIDIGGDGVAAEYQDLSALTYADESVAAVLSVDTIEHIPNWRQAIREIYRVLEDSGTAVIHMPCYYYEKPTSEPIVGNQDPWGHVAYVSARELIEEMDRAGFVVQRIVMNMDYGALVCALLKQRKSKLPA
jgi:SAM-dependent methyltransferase